MPSLKNIFTAKGYEVGSNYNREVGHGDAISAIQYRVVADGVPTYLVVAGEYFKEIHTEALGSVVHRIEDDMYTELEVLSQEQVEALQDRISGLVNQDTYELGLAGEDPENIDDRLIIYLTSWRDLHHPDIAQDGETSEEMLERADSINDAVSDQFKDIKDLETRQIIRLTAELASDIISRADDRLPPTYEQIENVFEWMMEKNSRHQITTMDKVINRYNQIQNLREDYQLQAADLGLSIEQAEIITPDQSEYIVRIHNHAYESQGVEILPEILQAKFEEVRDLREKHQIVSFHLGLTPEQARDVSPSQSAYLRLVSQNAAGETVEAKRDLVRAQYAQIHPLKELHQIHAFAIGLNAEQAQTISPDQTRYLRQTHNPETGAQGVQENYARIRNLPQMHQINGLNLGLSEEQALRIDPYESNYLSQTVRSSHTSFSPEKVQQIFQQIESLQPYQKTALRYGLAPLDAANLSEENFKEINDISNRYITLPRRGENNELITQRKFIGAYSIFRREQEAAQAQAKLDAEANLQASPHTNSVDNPPPPPSTTANNAQRFDKRGRETDGDETGSNKKPDRSH